MCANTFLTRLREEAVWSCYEVIGYTTNEFHTGWVCDDVAFCDLVFVAVFWAGGQTC
jgi:hypothetical protein